MSDETTGLTYDRLPNFPLHKNLDLTKFRRTIRPVGRPRDIGGALSRTPTRAMEEPANVMTGPRWTGARIRNRMSRSKNRSRSSSAPTSQTVRRRRTGEQ